MMVNEEKFSTFEIAGFIIIVLIMLYFPYKMIAEHAQDVVANSYYHNGK